MNKRLSDFIAEQRPMQDDGSVRRGELAFADWVNSGRITLPPPAAAVEGEGLTLRNYATRWRFVQRGEYDR